MMTKAKLCSSDDQTCLRRPKFGDFLAGNPANSIAVSTSGNNNDINETRSCLLSPLSNPSPYTQSPWYVSSVNKNHKTYQGLIGTLVRGEGHVYSLAAHEGLLYAGSEGKNVRVWEGVEEHSGFKSRSGLVKAIVVYAGKVFTGHIDGKIRVWDDSYKRIGTLPRFKDVVKKSMTRSSHRIRHHDAVSCLALSENQGLLYSGSWDKTVKCWRVNDSTCLDSLTAHDDAVNAVACGFGCLVFTGSADGKVKLWRREVRGERTEHRLIRVLLDQSSAVTSLAVSRVGSAVYCGSSDGLVNYWEKRKGFAHGGVLRGHKQAVLCLAAAGSLMFSGSADNTVCVWRRDASGGHALVSVLTGHTGPVKCLAVEEDPNPEPSGRRWVLYSGSLDKSVKVWRVSDTAPKWQQKAAEDDGSGTASPPEKKSRWLRGGDRRIEEMEK